jgi:ATP-dependent DNA helicase RecQ
MSLLEDAIKYGLSKLGYEELKGPQHEVIKAYALGKDVFLSSPTGSGKSLCFEIAPYVLDCVKRGFCEGEPNNIETVCVVVAPLISLMQDQVAALRQKHVTAICVGPECSSADIEDVKNGKYNLIFASPEALLRTHRDIFRSQLKQCIGAIFVDESHCIAKW